MAIRDIRDGILLWPLWGRLGWNDILQRYRRSLLGPFWLTASMAIMVVSLGVLYANLFKSEIQDFMPFLCVGLLVWNYISSVIGEAGSLFTGSESYIKQIRLPYSLYVYRFVWSRIIIFAHNFVIYFGILLYFAIWPGAVILLAIPGFILVTLNVALAEYLHRHGFGALSRHTSDRWKRYSDCFFYDTNNVETGTSGGPNLHRGIQSILPLDRGYASAVARQAVPC